jgi:hemolysin III
VIATFVAIAGLIALVVMTNGDRAKQMTMVVYGAGLVLLFGVSATYHVFNWPPRVREWLRRADHANIFIFIAATYTPLVFNLVTGPTRVVVLVSVWVLALAGAAGLAPFARVPRILNAAAYVGMGWVSLLAIPAITAAVGWGATLMMALAGLQYSLGALAWALRRPRLSPRFFGYHELFHLAVISASATFFFVIAYYAVPYHRTG